MLFYVKAWLSSLQGKSEPVLLILKSIGLVKSGAVLLKDEKTPPPEEFLADIWKTFLIGGLFEPGVFFPFLIMFWGLFIDTLVVNREEPSVRRALLSFLLLWIWAEAVKACLLTVFLPALLLLLYFVFYEYIKLPGLLGERLFHSFTTNNDCRYINESEFTTGLFNLFSSTLSTKILMTFKMYDFSGKGKITKEDVRVLMSYIPFKCFATSWGIDDSPR